MLQKERFWSIVHFFAEECSILDICVIVDSSGSIRDNNPDDGSYDNWQLVLQFIQDLVADGRVVISPDRTRVGVVVFSDMGEMRIGLGEHTNQFDLIQAISNLRYVGGNTNTAAGFDTARTMCFQQNALDSNRGDRPRVDNIAIIITDGIPTKPDNVADQRANEAAKNLENQANAKIFAVGVTDQVNLNLLREWSSFPKQENFNYFQSVDFQVNCVFYIKL